MLRPFLDHKDRRVQLTALAVLVRYKHAETLHRLESFLESRDPAVFKVATGLTVSIHPGRLHRIRASLLALPEERTACAALHSPSKCAGL